MMYLYVMKALLQHHFGNAETLFIGETLNPEPKQNELLIKVEAFGMNRADLHQREGNYPPPKGASTILGLECAGVVVQSNSSKFQIGDRVFGLLSGGGYAEFAVIHEDMAIHIPDYFSFEEAAAIPEAFLTAYQSLIWLGDLQPNSSVLIHAGASGVGNAAIQLAKSKHCKVYTTCSTSKIDFCKKNSADIVIDYTQFNFEDVIKVQTNGIGVDLIIDFIGGNYLMKNVNSLAKDGKIIQLATLGGTASVIDLRKLMAKRGQIIASTLRSRTKEYQIKLTSEFWSYAETFFQNEILKPVIDSVWSWNDITQAHLYMEVNRNRGKIIVQTH